MKGNTTHGELFDWKQVEVKWGGANEKDDMTCKY